MTKAAKELEIERYYQRRAARLAAKRAEEIAKFRERRATRLRTRGIVPDWLEAEKKTPQKTIDKSAQSVTIKSKGFIKDGGPGSGNHGHKGVPGQAGGSAPSGKSGITAFKRNDGKISVTSDVGIKRGKYGKATMLTGEITGVEDFAGVAGKKPVIVEEHLIEQFGGKPGTWRHTKGIGKIRTSNGDEKLAEIHWFENDEVGQIKWKVKRELKEEQK